MVERLLILWHFAKIRWGPQVRDRETLLKRQAKRVRKFLENAVAESPFYRENSPELSQLPLMSKAEFLANFSVLNRHGITLEAATSLALRAERERDFQPELPGGLTAGLSSGTSGTRHVFLVARGDRCRWAGQILARTLSAESLRRVIHPFAAPLRIAFFLRANSNLYTTLSGRRVKLKYYDLTEPFTELVKRLGEQQPHIIVAPATVLAELARREIAAPTGHRPGQILSVAEVLDARDRAQIEAAYGIPVAEIYQATEGFLAYTCQHGRLHLNEESMSIEPSWIDAQQDRFHPVITDFSRESQWFIRYQLDDILRIQPGRCACGAASQTLASIEGRAEEVLWADGCEGELSPVFPDTLRQALYSLEQPLDLYRIEQHGRCWEVRLRHGSRSLESAVSQALTALLRGLALEPPELKFLPWVDQAATEKQKRIRCISKPA